MRLNSLGYLFVFLVTYWHNRKILHLQGFGWSSWFRQVKKKSKLSIPPWPVGIHDILVTPQGKPSLTHHENRGNTAACGKFCRPAVCRTKSTNALNSCYKFSCGTYWFPSSCFMPIHRWHMVDSVFTQPRRSYHFQLHLITSNYIHGRILLNIWDIFSPGPIHAMPSVFVLELLRIIFH